MNLNSRPARLMLPLLPLAGLAGLFEYVIGRGWIPRYLLPLPSEVVHALGSGSSRLWLAAGSTALCALAGFALSLVFGMLCGILMASSRGVQRVFYPYAVFFQTVPVIAIAPLLVIWCGYGKPTVVAAAFVVSVFPVMASTLTGLLSTDPALVDLFRLYRSTPGQRLWKLRLPFALPGILTGARIAAGLAVIGAIVGEFIGGGGLGSIVDEARLQQRVDRMFAAVILASLIGLVFFIMINLASRLFLRNWHTSEKN